MTGVRASATALPFLFGLIPQPSSTTSPTSRPWPRLMRGTVPQALAAGLFPGVLRVRDGRMGHAGAESERERERGGARQERHPDREDPRDRHEEDDVHVGDRLGKTGEPSEERVIEDVPEAEDPE